MKYLLLATTTLLAVAVLAGSASARSYSTRTLSDAHVGKAKPELLAQRDFSSRIVRRLSRSWMVAPRHATCWSHVPWRRLCDAKRRELHAHRWLYHLATTRLARLYPSRPSLDASLVAAFACIHGKEGAWNANTGNGYYGGLQMDYGFMSTYGPEYLRRWGTADNWPAWAQLDAAIRAYHSGRGFGPWPNTARACGLL